jgi:hypothetical protein
MRASGHQSIRARLFGIPAECMERHQLLRAALEIARSERSFKRLQKALRRRGCLPLPLPLPLRQPGLWMSNFLANLFVMEQSIMLPRSDNPRQPRADWGVRSRRRGGGGIKILPSRFGWDVVQAIKVNEKQVDGENGQRSRLATRDSPAKSEQ